MSVHSFGGAEFWDLAGYPHTNMLKAIVMSAEDMVATAIAGLDAGEIITFPALLKLWPRGRLPRSERQLVDRQVALER